MSDIWIDEETVRKEAEKEVEAWFEEARKRGRCGINLYYQPTRDVFFKLVEKEKLHGIEVGCYSYKKCLYRVSHGPGDCEENLVFLGEMK